MHLLLLLALLLFSPVPAAAPLALTLEIDGAIGPAAEDYLRHGLARAREREASLLVLQIDTPGGLDTSMRGMVKDILSSPVPVATFVAPRGARAASAGTYILYASHVAAMAPATNLGAATPVQIGGMPTPGKPEQPEKKPKDDKEGQQAEDESPPASPDTMTRKQVHDAAAYLRSLAQFRQRNIEWAEKAVRESVSLPAEDALRLNVIDLIATDVADLLRQLDGRKLTTTAGERVLETKGAIVEAFEPDWRMRLLAVITDPNVALILMMLGIWGLFFELNNPGFVLPGVVGAISLLLALFAFRLLPVNYAGLLLILFGVACMIAEAFLPSFGSLGIGGLVAFVFGSLMLIDTEAPGFGVSLPLLVAIGVASALLLGLVGNLALRARRQPTVSGRELMLGSSAEVVSWQDGAGWARLEGELWQVRADAALAPGQRVRVVGADGLTLRVAPEIENNTKGG